MHLLFSIAMAAPSLQHLDVDEGRSAQQRIVADQGHELSLFYASEHDGEAGTCGCSVTPVGGLARTHALLVAAKELGLPTVAVHAGGALQGRPIGHRQSAPQSVIKSDLMVNLLDPNQWAVINVGWSDLGAAAELGPNWVSANLRPPAPTYSTHKTLTVNGKTVLITGVTSKGSNLLWPEGTVWTEPEVALKTLLQEHQADVVVVLAYGHTNIKSIAAVKGVDVLIDANSYEARWPANTDFGPVWARSWDQGKRLGELRFRFESNTISEVFDVQYDLHAFRLDKESRTLEKQLKKAQ